MRGVSCRVRRRRDGAPGAGGGYDAPVPRPRPALPPAPWLLLAAAACASEPTLERDVGPAEACEAYAVWPEDATLAEDALVERLVRLRAEGLSCVGPEPLPDLTAVPELRCAARRHALDLAERKTLSPEGADGSTPLSRAAEAGYDGRPYAELRAADFRAASEVTDALLADEAHCAALSDPRVTDLAAGARRSDDGRFIAWVILLGGPLE